MDNLIHSSVFRDFCDRIISENAEPADKAHALIKEIAKTVEEYKTDPTDLQTLADHLNEFAKPLAECLTSGVVGEEIDMTAKPKKRKRLGADA